MPETEEIVEKPPEPVVPPPEVPPETPLVEIPEEDEGRPTGDDPQAVRARKEYQARKLAQDRLEEQRIENIRLQERVKVLEEAREKPKEEKIYTIAEVNAFVEAGTINRAEADKYIEEKIFPTKFEQWSKVRESEQQKKVPVTKALETIGEYGKYIPGLQSTADPDYLKAANKVRELATQLGYDPRDPKTQVVALEMTFGSLERLRKKAESDALTRERGNGMPVETPGGRPNNTNGKVGISSAPKHLQDYWDKSGMTDAERQKHYEYYLKGQKKTK